MFRTTRPLPRPHRPRHAGGQGVCELAQILVSEGRDEEGRVARTTKGRDVEPLDSGQADDAAIGGRRCTRQHGQRSVIRRDHQGDPRVLVRQHQVREPAVVVDTGMPLDDLDRTAAERGRRQLQVAKEPVTRVVVPSRRFIERDRRLGRFEREIAEAVVVHGRLHDCGESRDAQGSQFQAAADDEDAGRDGQPCARAK